ncbi:MAG TPA: diaminopimelate epimerase [Burkholderiaceae bacterium]|nr:diaminopimelate epimerase [Burkholderiaceae bacterium]
MRLKFTKMQGAGNDFVMVDAVRQPVAFDAAQWRRLADRHFGVGADQILVVEPARGRDVDFRYRIFNQDGGEVEQCGNGARCFVRFVRDQGLTDKRAIRVETMAGIIEPRMEDDGQVTVDMGEPVFEAARVPFEPGALSSRRQGDETLWALQVDGTTSWVGVLSMGNPHAVQQVDDVERAPVTVLGPRIEHHPAFVRRVNAGFMQIVDRGRLRLRVWERGAGETLACGTGACAAVVSGIRRGLLDQRVEVATRGGVLTIDWRGRQVMMTGPATKVFDGEIEIETDH